MDNDLLSAKLIHEQTIAALEPKIISGTTHIIVPASAKLCDLTEVIQRAQNKPARAIGIIDTHDLAALLQVCADKAAQAQSYIYADFLSASITAVFNDNRGGELGWKDDRATLQIQRTKEYVAWLSNNNKPMPQLTFAEFIEDNFADVKGNATQLLDIATTLQAKTGISFSSSKRLDNGQNQLSYHEVIDAKAGADGALIIPRQFKLQLCLFENGPAYEIDVRLKYRLSSAGVSFTYQLIRPEVCEKNAFAEYVNTLQEKSGYKVLLADAP